jgi:hypothetical protein
LPTTNHRTTEYPRILKVDPQLILRHHHVQHNRHRHHHDHRHQPRGQDQELVGRQEVDAGRRRLQVCLHQLLLPPQGPPERECLWDVCGQLQ